MVCICPSIVICFIIIVSDACDFVYLRFDTISNLWFLSDLFISTVRAWTLFGLLLRFWINWSIILWLVTINSGLMINFIRFPVITTKNLIFCNLFNYIHFWSLIHQSTFPYLHHHVMNGEHTWTISTRPESLNHPIIGMRFLTIFLSVLNKSPLLSLFFQEDILVVLMRMSIPSLPHCFYQLDFSSYT